jgi:hypothetical protein
MNKTIDFDTNDFEYQQSLVNDAYVEEFLELLDLEQSELFTITT